MNVLGRKSFLFSLCLPLVISPLLAGCGTAPAGGQEETRTEYSEAGDASPNMFAPIEARPVSALPSRVLVSDLRVGVDAYFDWPRNIKHFGGYLQLANVLAVEVALENLGSAPVDLSAQDAELHLDNGESLGAIPTAAVVGDGTASGKETAAIAASFLLTGLSGGAATMISQKVQRDRLRALLEEEKLGDGPLPAGSSRHGLLLFKLPEGFAPSRNMRLQLRTAASAEGSRQVIDSLVLAPHQVNTTVRGPQEIEAEIRKHRDSLSAEIARYLVRTRSDLTMSQYSVLIPDFRIQRVAQDDAEVEFDIELMTRDTSIAHTFSEVLWVRSLLDYVWILDGDQTGFAAATESAAVPAKAAAEADRARKARVDGFYRYVSTHTPEVNAVLSEFLRSSGKLALGRQVSASAVQVLEVDGDRFETRIEYWQHPEPGQSATSTKLRRMGDFAITLTRDRLGFAAAREDHPKAGELVGWEALELSPEIDTASEFDDHISGNPKAFAALLLEHLGKTRRGFKASQHYANLRSYEVVEAKGERGRVAFNVEVEELRGTSPNTLRIKDSIDVWLRDGELMLPRGDERPFSWEALQASAQ